MTDQELYDRTRDHLLAQGGPSMRKDMDADGLCLYRGPNGTKCAAGFWIKDEFYSPDLEGTTANDRIVRDALELSHPGLALPLLRDLQRAHDSTARKTFDPVTGSNPGWESSIETELKIVAGRWGLKP